MSADYVEIRARLNEVSDLVGDRIVTLLSDAVSEGATKRPPEERTLTKVRTAVDKAIHLLDQLANQGSSEVE